MHVLFFTPFFVHKGGIERLLSYLCNFLVNEKNIDVSIVHEDAPGRPYYHFSDAIKIYSRNLTPFNPDAELRLKKLVEKIDPDVTVAMGSSRALNKLPRSIAGTVYPVILSEHNSEEYVVNSLYGDFNFYNAIRRVCDFNHLLSEDFSKNFARDIQDKIRIIENPIFPSDSKASMKLKSEDNYIVHIGRYDLYQKRQDLLVRSFAKIAKDYPSWKVLSYGTDWRDHRRIIQKEIDRHRLNKQFVLMGPVDDVDSVLMQAKLFAFPSKFEGFGLAVGEALAVGLPVVAFEDCKGVNKLVVNEYNGLLVPGIEDEETFAHYLKKLIDSEMLRTEMSKNAVQSINRYRPENFFEKWLSLLCEAALLKGKNRLLDLTDIEKDYLRLVASGFLFDAGRARSQSALRKIESLLMRKISPKCHSWLKNKMKLVISKLS